MNITEAINPPTTVGKIEDILRAGGNPDSMAPNGVSAIEFAGLCTDFYPQLYLGIIETLLKYRANPNLHKEHSPLCSMIHLWDRQPDFRKHAETVVKSLLAHGANASVSYFGRQTRCALLDAINAGSDTIATALVESGADLSVKDEIYGDLLSFAEAKGLTVTANAIQNRRPAAARAAESDKKQDDGTHANNKENRLIESARNGSIDEIKELLTEPIDTNATNQNGDTALGEASYYGKANAVDLLLAKGANANFRLLRSSRARDHALPSASGGFVPSCPGVLCF